jgi:urease accessory protein
MSGPVVVETILGDRADPVLAGRLHAVSHAGRVETLVIDPVDLPRRRFHARTESGLPCFVALARSEQLFDGAVLHLSDALAIVVRVGEQRWLRLRPADTAAAIELGYLAGNLHWRVRFEDGLLGVALEGPEERYLARLRELQSGGRVTVLG